MPWEQQLSPLCSQEEIEAYFGRDNVREWADLNNNGNDTEIEERKPCYLQLIDAVAHRRAVRIRYDSFTEGEVLRTKLSPYQVLFSRRSWYVIGRSSIHRETRTFNISRISEMESLEDSYKIPRGFSVERYLGNAWHLIPENGRDSVVEIHFQPMVAKNVAEVGWHKTQETEFQPDGSLLFRAKVSGLAEISWWILGYGDQAEVIRPPALREMVSQRAQRMVERYRTRGATNGEASPEQPRTSKVPDPHIPSLHSKVSRSEKEKKDRVDSRA